jgi:hypothetical protein
VVRALGFGPALLHRALETAPPSAHAQHGTQNVL